MTPRDRKIRVLVVDDSPGFRAALSLALSSDPAIEVVGQAENGLVAIELIETLRPDVVTMDAMMPVLDGLEAAERILTKRAVPILLMTTLARSDEQRMALNALRLGVVEVTNKPVLAGPGGPNGIASVIRIVKAAADVRLGARPLQSRPARPARTGSQPVGVIAIGCSTGGPPALERVFADMPVRHPPVVVAQHLAPSFARGFSEWLATAIRRPVVVATAKEALRPGHVYVAGELRHLQLQAGFVDAIPAGSQELAPSADRLFESAAVAYGANAVGVILSGMGTDGAVGLKKLRDAGAWTIGQDRSSSVVYGMPKRAAELGACAEILPLDAIGGQLAGIIANDKRTLP